jgi:hypothetical protein
VLQPFASRHRSGDSDISVHFERLRTGSLPEQVHAMLATLLDFAAPPSLAEALSRTDADVLLRRFPAG